MRFQIEKVVPLQPQKTKLHIDIIPQAEFTLHDRLTDKRVRVIWPHDKELAEGSLLPQKLEAGVLAMFSELFENAINSPLTTYSVGIKLTGEQLEAFDKLKDANPPAPIYMVICMSGEPCSMPAENFGDTRIGHQFRIDAETVANRLDKIKAHPDDYPMDHPKPAACGPHRVVPYCPIIEDNIHAEAERPGSGEAPPG